MAKHLRTSLVALWLYFYWASSQNQVEQSPPSLTVLEEENCTFQCNYTLSPFNNLRWYKHTLVSLIIMTFSDSDSKKSNGRYTATLNPTAKYSSLHITAAQLSEPAVHVCHCVDRGSSLGKLYFGRGTQLIVWPVIQDPDPAVYQLRDSKSSDTTVCLYTDFGSQINMTQSPATDLKVFNSTSTVLDMGAIGSKSNGVLSWSNSTSFGCQDAFSETFYASEEFPCDPKLVEKSFETDVSLNFQNLLVIVFRILLLKMVGFNLLMTLQLWSS
ncbi:M1-specific T cell receptor alpha chain [Camelus bactrianus]|uniref:M1-specific T cell receptor alpha chain n=1 Tax=Camelus bactrianus TaxID=9837 RepID=UPI003D6E58D4